MKKSLLVVLSVMVMLIASCGGKMPAADTGVAAPEAPAVEAPATPEAPAAPEAE